MEIMLTLGGYQFGLDTAAFQELNRTTEWRWPSQDVFESRPAVQFTGWGDDTITLPGVIYPEYWGGTGQLDTLRALGDSGQPQQLLDGRGNVLGDWVVTQVTERQSIFAQRGVGRKQEFTVQLKRYGRDDVARVIGVAAATAAAVTTTAGQAAGVATNAASRAGQAVTALQNAAASVQAIVSSVTTPLSKTLAAIGQATSAAKTVQQVAKDSQAAIKALGSIKNLSQAQAAVGGLTRAAGEASQIATTASSVINLTTQAMQANSEAASAISTVQSALVEVNKFAIGSSNTRADSEAITRTFEV